MVQSGDEDAGGPSWLKPLLRTVFFVPCKIHVDSSKSECNMYCLDCMEESLCSYCLSLHKDHRVVQVITFVLCASLMNRSANQTSLVLILTVWKF